MKKEITISLLITILIYAVTTAFYFYAERKLFCSTMEFPMIGVFIVPLVIVGLIFFEVNQKKLLIFLRVMYLGLFLILVMALCINKPVSMNGASDILNEQGIEKIEYRKSFSKEEYDICRKYIQNKYNSLLPECKLGIYIFNGYNKTELEVMSVDVLSGDVINFADYDDSKEIEKFLDIMN